MDADDDEGGKHDETQSEINGGQLGIGAGRDMVGEYAPVDRLPPIGGQMQWPTDIWFYYFYPLFKQLIII